MRTPLDELLTQFHIAYLKPRGFHKSRHTFYRDKNSYTEKFNIQGSQWNSSIDDTWSFYLNVGVEFKDLPPCSYWAFFANTHWADRIQQVVPGAPGGWEVGLYSERTALMNELCGYIEQSSNNLAQNIAGLREFVLEEKTGFRLFIFDMK